MVNKQLKPIAEALSTTHTALIGLVPSSPTALAPNGAAASPGQEAARRYAIEQATRPDPAHQYRVQALSKVITLLRDSEQITASVDTVDTLAKKCSEASQLMHELSERYLMADQYLSVNWSGGGGPQKFSAVTGWVDNATRIFSQIAFYKTQDGQNWAKGQLDGQPTIDIGGVSHRKLAHHQFELLDPLGLDKQGGVDLMRRWLELASKHDDPFPHLAEFFLGIYRSPNATILRAAQEFSPLQTRFNFSEDRRGANLVRIRSISGRKRMCTFQLKVAFNVGKSLDSKAVSNTSFISAATEIGENFEILSLPHLRAVENRATHRGFPGDFTAGALYVMEGLDKMYCAEVTRHHSSILGGNAVSAGGVLVLRRGRVVAIDNRSGHYRPEWSNLLHAVRFLTTEGLFEPDATVALFINTGTTFYAEPAEFQRVADVKFRFADVSKLVVEQRAKYRNRLPIPPASLSFVHERQRTPTPSNGLSDWADVLLRDMYGASLQSLVEQVKDWARGDTDGRNRPLPIIGRRAPTANSVPPSDRMRFGEKSAPANGPAAVPAVTISASQILLELEKPGAYCNILKLIRQLLQLSIGKQLSAEQQARNNELIKLQSSIEQLSFEV